MSKSVNIERKPVSGSKRELSDKLVGFILGVLPWNKLFTWDGLLNTLLNTFGKNISSRAINRVLIANNTIWTKPKFRPCLMKA